MGKVWPLGEFFNQTFFGQGPGRSRPGGLSGWQKKVARNFFSQLRGENVSKFSIPQTFDILRDLDPLGEISPIPARIPLARTQYDKGKSFSFFGRRPAVGKGNVLKKLGFRPGSLRVRIAAYKSIRYVLCCPIRPDKKLRYLTRWYVLIWWSNTKHSVLIYIYNA